MSAQDYDFKMAPHSDSMEEMILGACLLERDGLIYARSRVKEMDFYNPQNQVIWKAIIDLSNKSMAVDIQTVFEQLKKNGSVEKAGGLSRLIEISNKVSGAGHLETHCDLLKKMSMRRDGIALATQVQKMCYNAEIDEEKIFQVISDKLYEILGRSQKKQYRHISNVLHERLKQLDELRNRAKGSYLGIPSGIKTLDDAINGFQAPDLIVLAGRPGMGKTSLALSLCLGFSKGGYPGAFVSLEMSDLQLSDKLMAMQSNVPVFKVKDPHKRDKVYNEDERILKGAEELSDAPIYIDDTPGITIEDFEAKATELKTKYGIYYMIIDYLQLMTGSGRTNNREEEISKISRGIKLVCKKLNIFVIELSQLNRGVELRADKRPKISDLRESGSVEQDADMVLFPFRPEYYGITQDDETKENLPKGFVDLDIAKFRNGDPHSIYIHFDEKTTLFRDFEIESGDDDSIASMFGGGPDDDLPF